MVDEALKTTNPIKYRKEYIKEFAEQSGMEPLEKAAFMSRLHHETGGFRWMRELGGPEYFEMYEGRKTLGNNQPGDGYRFRGRGYIQLTGRRNYTFYGPIVGADLVNFPDVAADEPVAARVAVAFWELTRLRDGRTISQAAQEGDINAVVKGVNGGYNGKEETIRLYKQYLKEYGVI